MITYLQLSNGNIHSPPIISSTRLFLQVLCLSLSTFWISLLDPTTSPSL